MAVRKIIRMGHPALRRPARAVPAEDIGTEALHRLVADMFDTLRDYGGIGLAAPQINEGIRVAVIDQGGERAGTRPPAVLVNPTVEVLDETTAGHWEGCLSVPGLRGYVERPQRIRVRFTDLHGDDHDLDAEGLLATVVQHELDHLDGTLYVDRISDTSKLAFEEEYLRYILPRELPPEPAPNHERGGRPASP